MRKYIIYSSLLLIITIIIFIIFLSTYGFKTNKFNNLIKGKINTLDTKLSLDIKDVYLKLNFKEKSININTQNSKLYINKELINISKIDLNLDVFKFINKENSIKNIQISVSKSKIKDITNFINEYKFSIPRAIIFNQIEDGYIEAVLNIKFNENNQSELNYDLKGKISEAKLNILNHSIVRDINFDFNIEDKKYNIQKATFKYQEINFNSKEVLIKKLENNYEVKGYLSNKIGLIDHNYFKKISPYNLDFLENKKILAETNNEFEFKIDSKRKIKNLNLISKINFEEIFINKKIQNLIFLKNGNINLDYKKDNLKIDIQSGYSFINDNYKNNEKDRIKINIIKKKKEDFKVEATLNNKNNFINSIEFSNYLKNIDNIIKEQEIIFGSDNQINFSINSKNKIKNLSIKSIINLEKFIINYKSTSMKEIFPNYKNIIKTENNLINIDFSENKTNIVSKGNYSFENEYDKFDFEVTKNNKNINFLSSIEISKNPMLLKDIEYQKNKDVFSEIKLKGQLLKDKKINFKYINFYENENNISISNLYLSNDYKIIDIDKLQLKYLNSGQELNQLSVLKKNKKYYLDSTNFDGKFIIKKLIKNDSNENVLKKFKNLNSELILNFDHFLIGSLDYLKKIKGDILVENNKIKYAKIAAKINGNNDFNLNIKTNSKKEKVTNLYIDKPEPFIKNYKFIEGFNEGSLSFSSIEKDGISKSNLKIFDFKVKKVPVLAKILTLASLQGIADLLTGEGIRFDDFEMDFESSKNSTNIKEMYVIGPAISILMEGYIEKKKLTSLRGTLVPATTINKTISKIPLLGNILVGKKVGEGVFGVSFKIKGPPKNLKTTVNPVKTLTPRFITRTLDKLKKIN